MGLVFNERVYRTPVSEKEKVARLTLNNIKFLRSLGFKVKDAGYRKERRV